EQPHLHRIHRVAGQRSVNHRRFKSLLDRRDVLLRNHTTHNVVHKLETFLAVITGTDLKYDVRKLTATTSLLLVYFLVLNRSGKRFFVRHLGSTLIDLNFELALQTIDDDLKVKLTHTAENGLTGLLVGMNAQRRVFFHELRDRHAELVDISLLLRLNSVTDNRIREHHRLEYHLALFVAQRVAGLDILEAYYSTDVTSLEALDLVLLVRVHLEDARDTLLLS